MPTNELHTSKQFDVELEGLRSRVLQMGGLVESQIVRAVEALVNGNMALANAVVDDDHRVNALEVAIDEDCTHVIARREPAAGDYRCARICHRSGNSGLPTVEARYAAPLEPPVPPFIPIVRSTILTWR